MEQTNRHNVGVVGLGKMGGAIALGIHASGKGFVYGYDPFTKTKIPGIEYKSGIPSLEEMADIIILAVKPNDIASVVKEFKKPKTFLSIAAGISVATIQNNAPKGSKVSRLMPNLPLVVGRGAVGFFGEPGLDSLVVDLFSSLGTVVRLDKESLLDAVTGLSGSGPAYVMTFLHSLAEGGLKAGLSYSQSLDLALETIAGSVEYFRKLSESDPSLHPMEVRNWVTSPGGTTIYGLDALERGGFTTAVRDAVTEATKRSKELGGKE
ncbi:pyrroline-5-carboxylate reductase [Leptospira kobayashii]|uniref:Pyrroline-5-carboxylate reductase n=1 Tax=Leptospira kobayashii TaxID=1917830 RepID=A0ABM7UI13_9LEPT|nr:pyrroline-5-carboxylate reductase [Leptospira kobayashii]BDA78348.1 pyrroline-5-carboxylate reductase [Leptospira kobayashii]